MDGNIAHNFQKVIKAEDGLFEIKTGMLIGDRNRQCKSQL